MFTKNNHSFICLNCGKHVEPHQTSSRDHCTSCLYGQHVDLQPGDRLNNCKGLLKPVGLKIANNKKQIVYDCNKCFKRVFCIVSKDDSIEKLLNLSNKIWK